MADQGTLPSVFEDLRECSFRGVAFPVLELQNSGKQDHAVHTWPDRDGAHVEATGRAPLVFRIKAAFRNGIAPGRAEAGKWGVLYPDHFRIKFLPAVLDRTTGDFQHPELGAIKCKVASFDWSYDPHRRDGVDVDLELIESFDNPDDLKAVISAPSPIGTTLQFALDLDAQKTQITKPIHDPDTSLSLTDAMRKIQGVTDRISLLSKQFAGQIDHVAYRVNAISDSIDTLKDVNAWPIRNSCERLRSSLNDLKGQIGVAQREIGIYVTANVQTLPQLASTLGAKIDDLIALNRDKLSGPSIPRGTAIRYYKASP